VSVYPTGMVMLGAGKGQWQEGAGGLGHPGIVQGRAWSHIKFIVAQLIKKLSTLL